MTPLAHDGNPQAWYISSGLRFLQVCIFLILLYLVKAFVLLLWKITILQSQCNTENSSSFYDSNRNKIELFYIPFVKKVHQGKLQQSNFTYVFQSQTSHICDRSAVKPSRMSFTAIHVAHTKRRKRAFRNMQLVQHSCRGLVLDEFSKRKVGKLPQAWRRHCVGPTQYKSLLLIKHDVCKQTYLQRPVEFSSGNVDMIDQLFINISWKITFFIIKKTILFLLLHCHWVYIYTYIYMQVLSNSAATFFKKNIAAHNIILQ